MDPVDWNALNQLLVREPGSTKKVDVTGSMSYSSPEEQQYRTMPMGQAVYMLDAQGSAANISGQYALQLTGDSSTGNQIDNTSYTTSYINTPFHVKTEGARQPGTSQLNGATRQPTVETNVVKSLLTGQQYVQSNKNHQVNRSGGTGKSSTTQQSNFSGEGNGPPVKMSLLQSSWPQQQQIELDAAGGLVAKSDYAMQQMICSDTLPENVGPGEKVYVYVDGVAYEIITGSNQELIAQSSAESGLPLATGMSLEDLANVSAEQESLKAAEFQASVAEAGLADVSGSLMHRGQPGLQLLQGAALQDGSQSGVSQHYLQVQQQPQQQSTAGTTSDQEAMQIIIMQSDGDTRRQKMESHSSGGMDIMKMGVQDFMLQTGQSLPPELQEMVARGLDLSNCEFVIQDDDEMQQNPGIYLSSSADGTQFQGTISTDLQQQLASVINSSTIFANPMTSQTSFSDVIQPIAVMSTTVGGGATAGGVQNVNSNNVLALLASTAVANQEQYQTVSSDSSDVQSRAATMQVIAPEDEDDGEFAYLAGDQSSTGDINDQTVTNLPPRSHPSDAFLNAFLAFIQGNKPETLSSVANSTVVKKPPLPMYDPDLCRRPVQPVRQQGTSRTIDMSSGINQKLKSSKAAVTVSLVFTDPSGPSMVSVGGDNLGGISSASGESLKQISVTPFVVQKTDGKSVVLPGSEMQKYLPKATTKQLKEKVQNQSSGSESVPEAADRRTKEKLNKIINRKRRGSDEDSLDDSDVELGTISCMSDSDSDPAWKPASEESWEKKYGHLAVDDTPRPSRGRGRGRGRPRGSGRGGAGRASAIPNATSTDGSPATVGYILQVGPEAESGVAGSQTVNPKDPHSYQKGDFVVERKDAYKHDGFPIWKIEAGRLLQKYDPVESNTGFLHKSASVYSSWSGDIRTNFKAVMVELVTTAGRRFETVKVLDEYVPRPPDDSLEQDSMMELFNVYVQDVISQALDPSFLLAIQEQQEEYYLGPLRQIDGLLFEAQQTILAQTEWTEKFKSAIDDSPYYQMADVSPQVAEVLHCQATLDNSPAVKAVKFFGPVYNQELLQVTSEVDKATAEAFYVGQATVDHLVAYHALHHFKFLLFKKCEEEVQYLKLKRDKSDEIVLGECLQNRIFVQQCLHELKVLLEKCSIVITVVTKTEEEELGAQ